MYNSTELNINQNKKPKEKKIPKKTKEQIFFIKKNKTKKMKK